jgi:hypothetical protein
VAAIVTTPTENAALTWLQKHERLIVALVILAIGAWSLNRYFNHVDAKDKQVAAESQQQLERDKLQSQQFMQSAAVAATQFSATKASTTTQNAQLQKAVQVRTTQLITQTSADNKMTDPQLIARWEQLTKIPATDLTATSTGAVITTAGAEATVTMLEEVPTLTANSEAQAEIIQNDAKLVDASNVLIDKQTTEIAGLNTEIADEKKACTAEVTLVKAQARKSKLKWFGAGFIVGFVAGVVK